MNVYTELRAVDLVDAVEAIPNPSVVLAARRNARPEPTVDQLEALRERVIVGHLWATTVSAHVRKVRLTILQRSTGQWFAENQARKRAREQGPTNRESVEMSETKKPLQMQRFSRAEGKGFEPSTGFPAPDFESGR